MERVDRLVGAGAASGGSARCCAGRPGSASRRRAWRTAPARRRSGRPRTSSRAFISVAWSARATPATPAPPPTNKPSTHPERLNRNIRIGANSKACAAFRSQSQRAATARCNRGYHAPDDPSRRRRPAPVRRRNPRARLRAASARTRPHATAGALGVAFAVWAPNADARPVIGDFEGWGDAPVPLAPRAANRASGTGFIAGLGKGTHYKYRIDVPRTAAYRVDKADPYAFRSELPPATASIVWDLDYDWARRRLDARSGGRATRWTRRCRSTRCTWARGCASPRRRTAG